MPHHAHNPNNYGRALMSAPSQAIAPNPRTNLLNVYIGYRLQIKWCFNQKKTPRYPGNEGWSHIFSPCNPILFAICTNTFGKFCKQDVK
jgi:hypothetical protein